MTTPLLMMSFPTSNSQPILKNSTEELNSSVQPTPWLNQTTFKPSDFGLSCFTMIFGTVSNLTALGILAKSRVRFRRQSKAPFLRLTIALLMADLGGHLIPGGFAMYMHMGYLYKMQDLQSSSTFCNIFGGSMVFFGLCPLLFGSAMAVERCVAITQPFFHASTIKVTHTQRVVLLLSTLALVLSLLPFFNVGKYTPQPPNTWCFLNIHTPESAADTNLALTFSVLGLSALIISQFCNILSGVVLLHARIKSPNVSKMIPDRCTRRASTITSSTTSSLFRTLDVEMMTQLAVITVVSCVCWSPFLIHILVMQLNKSVSAHIKHWTLLSLRMASWNQVLDPWVYILLRRTVLFKVCCGLYTQGPTDTANSASVDTRMQILNQ